jgi:DNA (cytosine-5)-methyltransferase 1
VKPTVGSLFAGIGGIDLGFERAGFKTVWQVEKDSYCRRVLARHFPYSERHEDVREVGVRNLDRVDGIIGGFPCQDISNSGLKFGIEGSRSGLVHEFIRIIRELRPQFVLMENVAALLRRGMGTVLGALASSGYDAEWESIFASSLGCPQPRERVFLLAYAQGFGPQPIHAESGILRKAARDCARFARHGGAINPSDSTRVLWSPESDMVRVADGFPDRVDRINALGNAVVPQIPELIARQIYPYLS